MRYNLNIYLFHRIIDLDFIFQYHYKNQRGGPKLLQYIPGAVPPGNNNKFISHTQRTKSFFLKFVEDVVVVDYDRFIFDGKHRARELPLRCHYIWILCIVSGRYQRTS